MSVKKLTKLIPPPKTPTEPGSKAKWAQVEKELGTPLPTDYKEFITKYGSGTFARFFFVYNPFDPSPDSNLLARAKSLGETYRERHEEEPDDSPYLPFPEPGGILPWGHDENGNFYFWLTKGKPDAWKVVADEPRGDKFDDNDTTMSEYLLGVLEKRIPSKASGYPNEGSFEFKPALVISDEKAGHKQLFKAAAAGDLSRVRALLDSGVKPNDVEATMRQSVVNASINEAKDIEVTKLLLARGAKAEGKDLTRAAQTSVDYTNLMLDAGVHIDVPGLGGQTALYVAVNERNVEMVKMLLKAGANSNSTDEAGRSPIFSALDWRNAELVKILIDADANLTIRDEEGLTPLEFANQRNNPGEIIEMLRAKTT